MKYPISPDYIQAAGEHLTPLYQSLEDYVIEKICEQFRTGEANATALELIRELQRRGLDLREIEKRIRQVLGISVSELNDIFDDAIARNEAFYGDALDKMGLAGESYQMEAMRLEADAIARQTMGEFVNLTRSMGFAMQDATGQISFFPIRDAYQAALDRAAVQVLSGADSYDVAIKQAVKSLTDSGLQTVDYESGHHDRVDVAVRRAVMTGVVQVSSKYTEQMAEDIPTPYREVSAHSGARDIDRPNPWSNHKTWQGRVYSLRTGDKYPNIYAVCGWGEVDGLEGANCRHVHYPFWDGISERSYTDEELANIDPPPIEFEGRKYTRYEATQQQRKIERALRAVKRRMVGMKGAGQDDGYTTAAVKYRRLNEEYDKFTKAAGLRSQKERSYIPEFGPKEARNAVKASQNGIALSQNGGIMKQSGKRTLHQEGHDAEIPAQFVNDFSEFEPLSLTNAEKGAFRNLRELSDSNGFEHGCAIIDGKAQKPFTSFKRDEVKIPKEYLEAENVKLYHAHTDCTVLSKDDLRQLTRENVQEIGVITNNGDVFTVSRGYGDLISAEEYDNVIKDIAKEAYKEAMADPGFFSMNMNQRHYLRVRTQMRLVVRHFGWSAKGGRI